MMPPLVCSLAWASASALLLACASVCFFCMSACTLPVEILPSPDRLATCWRLTNAILAPAGNGRGGTGAGAGCAAAGGAGEGVAGRARPAGWGETGAALSTRASDAAKAAPFITVQSFREQMCTILPQIQGCTTCSWYNTGVV